MAKFEYTELENLENEQSAVDAINANFEAVQNAIEKTLSRDGTAPNTLSAAVDANGQRIYNLPAPSSNSDAARHGDLQTYVDDAEAAVTAAEGHATTAAGHASTASTAATNAQTAETNAETAATNAQTAETNAETAEANAEAAEALAEKWAEEAEDVEVTTGKYSAKHWAAKAEEIVLGDILASGVTVTPVGTVAATDVQSAIQELDSEKQATSAKGQANGYAALDATTQVPIAQIPVDEIDYTDLANLPTLFSGAYADLSGKPTLGTAAAQDVGTGPNDVVQLNGSSQLPAVDGSLLTNLPSSASLPNNYLTGLILSNNSTDPTNDINITVGQCRDSTNAEDMVLAAALTKRLDASWAVGTNAGGLDTGSIANTTYHVFLIKRSDTDVVDVLFSTSATSPTMPANYNYKRRIGSIVRASGAIRKFIQTGDLFLWESPIRDLNVSPTGTSAVTRTLTVPTGIKVEVFAIFAAYGTDDNYSIASSLDSADIAPSVSQMNFANYTAGATYATPLFVRTNTSAQVRTRNAVSSGLMIHTLGWRDLRGKEG